MDSGVAVVLGAVIALIGAVVTPWVKDLLDRRTQDRRMMLEQRGAAILAFLRALDDSRDPNTRGRVWELHSRLHETRAQLAMLAAGADASPVEALLGYASIRGSDNRSEPGAPATGLVVTVASSTLLAWHRGDLRGAEIWEHFVRRVGPVGRADIEAHIGEGGIYNPRSEHQ